MSYVFYKVLHLTGIIMIFTALGAALLHSMNGGGRNFPHKKWVSITHGIGLAFALVAGFGLMARLGLQFTGWLWVKTLIWIILGGVLALIYRKPKLGLLIWPTIICIGGFATWLANIKPF